MKKAPAGQKRAGFAAATRVKKSKITAHRAATIQCRVPQRAAGQFQAPLPPAFTVELTEYPPHMRCFAECRKGIFLFVVFKCNMDTC
jgi:hypothetical protein